MSTPTTDKPYDAAAAAAPANTPAPAAPPAATPNTTDDDAEANKRCKKIIMYTSAAVLTLAIAIPLLCKIGCGDDDDADEDSKVAQGPAVLSKLVGWVKEATESNEDETENDLYTELENVEVFSSTQSV